jgi:hypothetical protein
MEWSGDRHARGETRPFAFVGFVLACALALGGCNPDGQGVSAAQPRGATVAFDSLDGLPPSHFKKLVQDLNDEAQSRRLAIISREQPSAYRVRGYLAAKVSKRETTITWVWDVFDTNEQRALRITGEETAKIRHKDAWTVADDAMLHRIANTSVEQLAAFLTSPDVAPGAAPTPEPAQQADSQAVAAVVPPASSPEAAGIYRMTYQRADPVPTGATEPTDADETEPVPVPLPPHRPGTLVSTNETLLLAASANR